MVDVDGDAGRVETHRARDLGRTLRGVLAGVLLAILIALIIDNGDDVTVGWVFGESDVPLALVVIVAGVAGALLGWLLLHRPRRRR